MGLKPNEIIQEVLEWGRREREQWEGIFSCDSTSPIQPRVQHSHPITKPGGL